MALSQIQCLDDNHINPRTNESKPEFLYSEDQRLALEALLGDGREAFVKYLEARGLRGFLSDLEQETLTCAVEPYDPNSDVFPEGADENEPPLSLHYWPELSDTTIPLMDIGWPDYDSYRGVTRTTVYTQPPLEGQTHVKEIVRKMIAQAQKVIAVVMDVFTDVDIFKDLLDASFKRRVSVYILLEHTMLPQFLSMCQRANMHAGHLKHLRVRFSEGTEFYTRSCTKVRGRMGHRFMFVDGDKALSGSYSFTWMSSRLDRNLITVITGQAVEAFDRLFRSLYMNSRFVNLRQVALAPEPEPEPIAQPVSVPLPSAALARKLHNPKYALVTVGNHSPASTPSPGNNSPKDSQAPEEPENKKRRRRKSLEAQEAPPLHPGLVNLEKAALIAYLPTWPEPDPPSDVIGFINIRDSSKPTPVHLQRSEMFGTSQAIRFSSPFSNPKETLPEVAKPRQLNNETKVKTEHQQKQDKSKTEEAMLLHNGPADGAIKNKEPEKKMAASPLKSAPVKNSTEPLNTQHNLNSNAPDTRPPLLSRSKPPTPNTESPSDATQTASTNKQVSSPAANDGKETQTKACLNTKQSATTQNRNHTLESKYTHLSADSNPVGEKPGTHTQSQFAPDTQVSTSSTAITDVLPVSSTRKNNPNATVQPRDTTHFSPSPLPKQVVTSPYMTLLSSPPVPKPRTILLTSKDEDNKQEPQKVQQPNNPPLQPSADSPQRNFADAENSTTVAQGDPGSVKETRHRETSAEMGVKEAVGSRAHTQTSPEAAPRSQSDALIASKPNAESMHIQEAVSKEAEREALMSGDGDVNPKPQREPLHAQTTEIRANREIAKEVPALIKENVTRSKSHFGKPDETQIASSCEANSPITSKWTTLDSLKGQTQHVEDSLKPSPAENNSNSNNSNGQVANAQISNRPLGLTLSNAHAPELHSQKSLVCLKAQGGLDVGDGTMPSPAKKSTQGTSEEQEETNHIPKTHLGSTLSNTQAPELCSQKTLGSLNAQMQGGTDIHDSSMPSPAKNVTQGTTHDQIVSPQTPKRPTGLSLSNTQATELHSQKTLDSLNAQIQGGADVDVSSMPSPAKNNAQGASQGEEVSTLTPKTPIGSSPFNAYTPELRSPTPEKESLLLAALMRSPTPDGLRQCSSTPDFRTPTPDFRSLTPDFRSGTPLSDGYTSTRDDSTSDEFYECSDSPVPEPVCGAATEGRVNSTSHSSVLSSSSVVERVVRSEEVKQEESGKSGEEGGNPGFSEGENPVGNHVDAAEKMQIVEDSAVKTADKQKEAQTQRRKKVVSQPAAETPADGGAIPAESTAQQTEPKRSSACDVIAEETGVSKRAAAPTVEEKSDRLQASRDTGGHTQQGIAALQSSRQPQQSRPHRSFSTTQLAGSQSWGSSPLSQADPMARHGSTHALDYTSRKAPPRPVPPHAAAHKQAAPHGQQTPLSRQPHAAQARVRGAPPQDQPSFPKPPTSFLQQRNPPPQNRAASAQEARRQDEGRVPFSFSFSRLYNLKGLKDKIGRIPAQSKRSSTSPQQNHHHHHSSSS